MVLVDTSVWIRFLAGRAPYASGLDELLQNGDVCGHECVYGELLLGTKGGRTQLLSDYARMHQCPVISHQEVVEFVRQRHLNGRGVGWVDVHLLASALVAHATLWTADARLADVATECGVNHK